MDADKHAEREVVKLVKSSANSWASEDVNVMPDYQTYPRNGFVYGVDRNEYTLAATSKGRFESYFKDKESPLLPENSKAEEDSEKTGDASAAGEGIVYGSVIQSSSDSACLVVIGSNNFAEDMVLSIASQGMGSEYAAPVDFCRI